MHLLRYLWISPWYPIQVRQINLPLQHTLISEIIYSAGSNISYTWDFGDGTPSLITDVPDVQHTFTSPNCYNVTVIAENLLDHNVNFTIICIEDIIKDLNLNVSQTSEVNVSSTFYLSATSGSDYVCTWDWGDGSPIETTDEATMSLTQRPHGHTYQNPAPIAQAPYFINVTCVNNISADSFVLEHRAQLPILGLDLDSYGAETGSTFDIGFFITQGTDPNFRLFFDGALVPMTYDLTTMTGVTTATLRRDVTGIYSITLKAWNDVSNIVQVYNFTCEVMIRGATLISDPPDPIMTTGDKVKFTLDCTAGSSVEQEWDFKDGQTFSQYTGLLQDWSGPQVIEHVFDKPGDYNVTITLTNNINEVILTQQVVILSGIDNVTLQSDSPVAYLYKAGRATFWFKVDGKPPYGAETKFDFGDGTISNPVPFEEGKEYTHDYALTGNYTVKATVYNPIDTKEFFFEVWVIEPVSNLNLYVEPPHASINEPVSVCISMDKGQGVTLTWNFDDPPSSNIVKPRQGRMRK